jgi:hypothetical protein
MAEAAEAAAEGAMSARAEQAKWKAVVQGEDEDQLRQAFVEWLSANGARYPKIDWPSCNTESGIRGGIAKEAIATGECMIEIPVHLMMSPVAAFADPVVGHILSSVKDLLYGDLMLCVYIMHEMRKGKESFYYPFLKILPEPGNISEWSNDDLMLLQVRTCSLSLSPHMSHIPHMSCQQYSVDRYLCTD